MDPDNTAQKFASGKLSLSWPSEHIAILTLSNTEKRNALDHELLDAIAEIIPPLQARCVIITGSERMFSAGYDIANLQPDQFAKHAERLIAHPFTAAIESIAAYPFPTVAALNGHTIGGGLELALACDLRIAANDIKLGMPPAKLGLIYSHTGIAKFIEIIGAARTRELFLRGRNVDAQTALSWNLVNVTSEREEFVDKTLGLANELANNAPLAQKGNKTIINTLLERTGQLDSNSEQQLIELRRSCFDSADFREGVQAFAEKRQPRWQGN